MAAITLTHKEGMKLLKEGNTLTRQGKNLDTLSMEKDGLIKWMGIEDIYPTWLEPSETKSLFKGKIWHLNIR